MNSGKSAVVVKVADDVTSLSGWYPRYADLEKFVKVFFGGKNMYYSNFLFELPGANNSI